MIFLRSFHVSLHQAVNYYNDRDKSVARRFIDAVEKSLDQIRSFPKIGKRIKNGREYLLAGFPYSLCYVQDIEGEPIVIRVFHYKRGGPRIPDRITLY